MREKIFEMGRGDSYGLTLPKNTSNVYECTPCMGCVEGVQNRQNTIFFQFPYFSILAIFPKISNFQFFPVLAKISNIFQFPKSGYFQYFPIFPFSTIFQYFPISRNFQFFPSLQFPKFSSYAEKKRRTAVRPSVSGC